MKKLGTLALPLSLFHSSEGQSNQKRTSEHQALQQPRHQCQRNMFLGGINAHTILCSQQISFKLAITLSLTDHLVVSCYYSIQYKYLDF
jgi:hypothetical protein